MSPRDAAPLPFESIDAFIVDVNGNALGKRVPAARWTSALERGVQFSAAALILDSTGAGHNPLGFGTDDGDPDGSAFPIDPMPLPVPWSGSATGQAMLAMRDPVSGSPYWFDPREILRNVIAVCRRDGLRPVVACELEFYLVARDRDAAGRPAPPIAPSSGIADRRMRNLSIQQVEDYDPILRAVLAAGRIQGLHLGGLVAEYGRGQFEVNLEHLDDPLRAADEAVLLRRIVQSVARSQGLDATFMPKPFLDQPGSGLHVHLSLIDESGRNRFAQPGGEDLLRATIAGYQALLPESLGLFAPGFNAYRRFAPGQFAPVNRDWAENNRSVAFRIPVVGGEARRVEHRVAAANASPHLVLAALLAAMHHGVTGRLIPTDPVTGNAGHRRDSTVPTDFFSALQAVERAQILPTYLPPRFLALYAALKRGEFARLTGEILPAEYDFYL